MSNEYKPRLKWRKTWAHLENDFVAIIPGALDTLGRPLRNIGRIHLSLNNPHDIPPWIWYYQASFPGLPWRELPRGGREATAREAAKRIEDIWFKATAGTPYEDSHTGRHGVK